MNQELASAASIRAAALPRHLEVRAIRAKLTSRGIIAGCENSAFYGVTQDITQNLAGLAPKGCFISAEAVEGWAGL